MTHGMQGPLDHHSSTPNYGTPNDDDLLDYDDEGGDDEVVDESWLLDGVPEEEAEVDVAEVQAEVDEVQAHVVLPEAEDDSAEEVDVVPFSPAQANPSQATVAAQVQVSTGPAASPFRAARNVTTHLCGRDGCVLRWGHTGICRVPEMPSSLRKRSRGQQQLMQASKNIGSKK